MNFSKFFLGSFSIFLITQSILHFLGGKLIQYIIYAEEIFFVLISAYFLIQKYQTNYPKSFKFLFLFILYIIIHIIINPNSNFIDIFKLLGPIIIFYSSYYLASQDNKTTKLIAILISIIPIAILLIDKLTGYQHTPLSLSLFINSNNYIYFSLCSLWLLLLYNIPNKIVAVYLIINFLVSSTLGAFLAFGIAMSFYLRVHIFKPKNLFYVLIGCIFLLAFVFYSDIYIFQRIRGTGKIILSLLNNYSLNEIPKVEFGTAMGLAGAEDGSNVSFLFRLKIWIESFDNYLHSSFLHLLFGLGFRSTPSYNSFGLVAHNDYLTWLMEGGIIGFSFIIFGLWHHFKKLIHTIYILPYLSILIYFFTENLFYNFLANLIFAFCLSLSIKKLEHENFTN